MNTDFTAIDLTHELAENIPSWDGGKALDFTLALDYPDCTAPDIFRKYDIKSSTGIGTHLDAPAHVVPGGRTIDQLTLEELIAPCVVIDVSAEASENYIAMPAAVERFEQEHGPIPAGSVVIFYTGWDKKWATPEQYHNNHVFPSVHISTAELLLTKGVAGIGIDTFSCDTGAHGFPVHRAVLGADKYLLENIANAGQLPLTGSKVLVLPMNIKGATEAPLRLIAII